MSGGAYDYFYYKISDDLGRHLVTLGEMILHMEEDPDRYDPEATKMLKEFGARMTAAQEEANRLSILLHDVEWVASNDYGPDAIKKEVARLKADLR